MNQNSDEEYEVPSSLETPIPKFLKLTYLLLPLWGILCFYLYWNGSEGVLDPGSWQALQKSANTTYVKETPKPQEKLEAK